MQTVSALNLSPLLEEIVDWRYKGFPPTAEPVAIGALGGQGWNALDGDLVLPLLLIRETALDHNIALMARFCREHGVCLAPHGKTPMAPQIVQRQLEAGAWGITAATVSQARVFRAFGVRRILVANEVLEPAAIAWMAAELGNDPQLDLMCLVDSVAGVESLAAAMARLRSDRPLPVLLEWGATGARAGARTAGEVREIAGRIRGCPSLRLAGVEGYEGAIRAPDLAEKLAAVDRYLQELRRITVDLSGMGAFDGLDEIIVSAGGSLFVDRVVAQLAGPWNLPRPVRVVLRSGSYVAHDADEQERVSPLARRGGRADGLRPALELWGQVLSRPEGGLAVVGFGKRDVSYDVRLPMPFAGRRAGSTWSLAGKATVTMLNDQHAYLQLDPACDLAVGDLVGCHISHPCTAFDKWRLLPLVGDDYGVTGAIRTFF